MFDVLLSMNLDKVVTQDKNVSRYCCLRLHRLIDKRVYSCFNETYFKPGSLKKSCLNFYTALYSLGTFIVIIFKVKFRWCSSFPIQSLSLFIHKQIQKLANCSS